MMPEGTVKTNKSAYAQQQQLGKTIVEGLAVGNPFFAISMYLSRFLLSICSLTVEVFLRFRFGERYLNTIALWIAFLLLFILASHSRHLAQPPPMFSLTGGIIPPHSSLTGWFIVAFIVMAVFQRVAIFRRNWIAKQPFHSFAEGTSLLEPPFRWIQRRMIWLPRIVPRFIEPLAIVFLTIPLHDPFLERWLLVSAFALFVKEAMAENAIRARYLDLQDSKLEAEALAWFTSQSEQGKLSKGTIPKYRGHSVRLPQIARPAQQEQKKAA